MSESQGLSKDDKMALAANLLSQIDLVKAKKVDIYDVLIVLAHLSFPGREITLSVSDSKPIY
jgi:hypothetical protein